jgi:hypothetical protein
MRWRAAACVALGTTAVVCSAIAAAAPPEPSPVAPPAPEPTFHSVRSYVDVAEPVRLRIPTLGIDAPLTHLGVAPDRSIEVPTDYATPGWFKAGPAVFYRLARLPVGAQVLVDRADGSTIGFRVRGTQHVAKVAFPTDLVYAPTLEPALRLVTCGGLFDHTRSSYLDNVIVYADP